MAITILLANGLQLNIKADQRIPPSHTILIGQDLWPIPAQALWALALAIFLWFILNRHKFGEAIMFIGDNPNVARVMGINVEATRIKLFTLMGVIAAFAGLLLTIEMNVFYPTQGQGFMLPVMAAVFIGGTSISGGTGSYRRHFFRRLYHRLASSRGRRYRDHRLLGPVGDGPDHGRRRLLNVLIGEGRISKVSARIRHWVVPAHPQTGGEPPANNDASS